MPSAGRRSLRFAWNSHPLFLITVTDRANRAMNHSVTPPHAGGIGLTLTHIFLPPANELISLADPAAAGGRARDWECGMKRANGPRLNSVPPTWVTPDA